MSQPPGEHADLVPLGQAEQICREKLGMSAARFRHELAEHVRGPGGIPWVARETAAGVHKAALDEFIRRMSAGEHQEKTSHD